MNDCDTFGSLERRGSNQLVFGKLANRAGSIITGAAGPDEQRRATLKIPRSRPARLGTSNGVSWARSWIPTRSVSADRGPDPPRQPTNSDRVPLASIQFATELLRHCVTRSHRARKLAPPNAKRPTESNHITRQPNPERSPRQPHNWQLNCCVTASNGRIVRRLPIPLRAQLGAGLPCHGWHENDSK